jgi:hypothetical protein
MRIKVIKKDGKPVAVRAAEVNGRVINIALKDESNCLNWYNALEKGIPSLAEWLAISENFEAVNKALKRAGGEPLKDEYYWSSSEYGYNYDYHAWVVRPSGGGMDYGHKNTSTRVRCVFIEEK